jgi:hypothetical protein
MDQGEIDPGLGLHRHQLCGALKVMLGLFEAASAQEDLAELTMDLGVVWALFQHAEPGPGRAFEITALGKHARISFKSLSLRFHVRAGGGGLCDLKEKDGPEGPS